MLRLLNRNENVIVMLTTLLVLLVWISDMIFGFDGALKGAHRPLRIDVSFGYEQGRLYGTSVLLFGLLMVFGANRMGQGSNLFRRITNFPFHYGALFTVAVYPFITLGQLAVFGLMIAYTAVILNVITTERMRSVLYNGGFLLGLASILATWMLAFVVPAIYLLVASGKLSWKHLLVYVVGILTPFYFLGALGYLFELSVWSSVLEQTQHPEGHIQMFLLLPTIGLGIVYVLNDVQTSTVRDRRKWWWYILFSMIALAVLFLETGTSSLMLIGFPLMYFFTKITLLVKRKFLGNLLYLLFIVTLILLRFADQLAA